jgi:Leucine-rich repeat (LRR) protein
MVVLCADDEVMSGFPPEILELSNLEYLSLQFQGLVSVPPQIANLKKLSVLNVSHNPHLLSVSAQLASLPLKRKSCQSSLSG